MESSTARALARAAFLPARVARRLVPASVRKHLEDRLFYSIFQLTRVTNDSYPDDKAKARTPRGGGGEPEREAQKSEGS